MKKLREEKFDFGITEFYGQCSYILYKEIGIKNYASTFATDITDNYFGVGGMPSYVPGLFKQIIMTRQYLSAERLPLYSLVG